MKMPFQKPLHIGVRSGIYMGNPAHNEKINRTAQIGGDFTSSLSHPRQDILRAGFNCGIPENFRDLKDIPYPNRGRHSGGP